MSTLRSSAGLGFDLDDRQAEAVGSGASEITLPSRASTVHFHNNNETNVGGKSEHSKINPSAGVSSGTCQDTNNLGLRSMRSMRGLLLAEVGASMVEFDTHGSAPGFKEGHLIAPQVLTPGGGTRVRRSRHLSLNDGKLIRQPTLLSVACSPARNAVELKSLLGDSNAKLKAKAKVLGPPGSASATGGNDFTVSLEQARSRARLELDLILTSNAYVQGGHVRGHIVFRVRKKSKKEGSALLSDAKLRVVGFECIPNGGARHVFYQYTASLDSIASTHASMYTSPRDLQGYAEVKEGVHNLPFTMQLPIENPHGFAKGVVTLPSGVAVRYIAMVSVRVKDSHSEKQSIAHFYRQCEIWPRLDPSLILLSAPRPIQSTTTAPLFMGGSGRVKLTAYIHRLYWVSGQRCYVTVSITNDTKRTIRAVTLTLIRATTIFKPNPALDANPRDADPDACQTSTSRKEIATSTLEMGQKSMRGHASAKGWWTGVGPDSQVEFQHFIQLPPDALSVMRGRLIEVEYTLRVSASAGSLTSDIHVVAPLRIVNFMSIDPPPSTQFWSNIPSRPGSVIYAVPNDLNLDTKLPLLSDMNQGTKVTKGGLTASPPAHGLVLSNQSDGVSPIHSRLQNPHSLISTRSNTEDGASTDTPNDDPKTADGAMSDVDPESLMAQVEAELQNMSLSCGRNGDADIDDDDEAFLQFAVGSARLDDNDGHFAHILPLDGPHDRAISSLVPLRVRHYREATEAGDISLGGAVQEHILASTLPARARSKTVSDVRRPTCDVRDRPSFAERVQEKLMASQLAESVATPTTSLLDLPCKLSAVGFEGDVSRSSKDHTDVSVPELQEHVNLAPTGCRVSKDAMTSNIDYPEQGQSDPGRPENRRQINVVASRSTPVLTKCRHNADGGYTKESTTSTVPPAKGVSSVRARIAELERRVHGCQN